jgi:hypothetical protein
MQDWHLMRAWFRTDHRDPTGAADNGNIATISATIGGKVFQDGSQVVAVDWDKEPGWVEVTFLVPGRGRE